MIDSKTGLDFPSFYSDCTHTNCTECLNQPRKELLIKCQFHSIDYVIFCILFYGKRKVCKWMCLCLIHAMSQVKVIDCQGAGAGAFKATFTIAAGGGTGLGEIGESLLISHSLSALLSV